MRNRSFWNQGNFVTEISKELCFFYRNVCSLEGLLRYAVSRIYIQRCPLLVFSSFHCKVNVWLYFFIPLSQAVSRGNKINNQPKKKTPNPTNQKTQTQNNNQKTPNTQNNNNNKNKTSQKQTKKPILLLSLFCLKHKYEFLQLVPRQWCGLLSKMFSSIIAIVLWVPFPHKKLVRFSLKLSFPH